MSDAQRFRTLSPALNSGWPGGIAPSWAQLMKDCWRSPADRIKAAELLERLETDSALFELSGGSPRPQYNSDIPSSTASLESIE